MDLFRHDATVGLREECAVGSQPDSRRLHVSFLFFSAHRADHGCSIFQTVLHQGHRPVANHVLDVVIEAVRTLKKDNRGEEDL